MQDFEKRLYSHATTVSPVLRTDDAPRQSSRCGVLSSIHNKLPLKNRASISGSCHPIADNTNSLAISLENPQTAYIRLFNPELCGRSPVAKPFPRNLNHPPTHTDRLFYAIAATNSYLCTNSHFVGLA